MAEVTIVHTAEHGTLLEGTVRGDGTYEAMAAVRKVVGHWRWARSLGCWIVVSSRDRQPKQYLIDYAAKLLREAGHTVELDIDRTARAVEDAEADRAQRQSDRVSALVDKASRRDSQAAAAETAHQRAHEALPPFGEPIKIGHHSEHRHRRAFDRADKAWERSVLADRAAEHAHQRAEAAKPTTERRYAPRAVANRIDTLEADQRGDQRLLDGYSRRFLDSDGELHHVETTKPATGEHRTRVLARVAQRDSEIAYWKRVRQSQIDEGLTPGWGREDFTVGDFVRLGGKSWRQITRVNAKSVSVVNISRPAGDLHTIAGKLTVAREIGADHPVRYHDITALMSEEQARERFPDIFAELDACSLPPRPKRRGGKTTVEHHRWHSSDAWSWRIDDLDYTAIWEHPPGWHTSPPQPVSDPPSVRVRAERREPGRVRGESAELAVTEFAATAPLCWPEEVHNQVRRLIEARAWNPST